MSIILIGNIVALLGACLMVAIGLIKNKKTILLAQCAQFAIMGLGNFILGGVSGAVSNFVSILRNLFCCRFAFGLLPKIGFIALQLLLTVGLCWGNLLGWLPVIAAVVFTWFLDLPDPAAFKKMMIFCQILWLVYDLALLNFVAAAFDVFAVVSNLAGISAIRRAPVAG